MQWSLDSYEDLIYRIRDFSPHILFTTLVLQRRGKLAGLLKGEIVFANNLALTVYENLNFLFPDIKHHRIPASGLSFNEPNLPLLIREIESLFFRKITDEQQ